MNGGSKGRKKQPYYIRMRDDRLFAFASIWERWLRIGESMESCSILTTNANEVVKPLHERMPVILSPGDYDAWLDPAKTPAKLSYLFEPFPADEMVSYAVNPVVNSTRHEGADCIDLIDSICG